MTVVNALHRTSYRFSSPVTLGPHRMMLRARESRDLRLHAFELRISPTASVTWATDVAGNAIATARFDDATESLTIESRSRIEITAATWPVFDIALSAARYPFEYSAEDAADLGPLTAVQAPDPDRTLATWAEGFVLRPGTDTLSLLKDLSLGIAGRITYRSRETEGTQTPVETLELGSGSCRDMAVLFVEAARTLGFGARIVSGYLFDPVGDLTGSSGSGSTHAWAEVYLTGAGWITFDPTNRNVGGGNLVPVAVGRELGQVQPVSGVFVGTPDAVASLDVEVLVSTEPVSGALAV